MPRARSISVRLSDEEFASLERYCVASGARSISDLARNAICGLLNRTQEDSTLRLTVREHSELVKLLQGKIEQLTTEIGLLKGKERATEPPAREGGAETSDEDGTDGCGA